MKTRKVIAVFSKDGVVTKIEAGFDVGSLGIHVGDKLKNVMRKLKGACYNQIGKPHFSSISNFRRDDFEKKLERRKKTRLKKKRCE